MKPKEYEIGKPEFDELTNTGNNKENLLVLHNDDIHTFDFVIECLIEVCNMDTTRAEQCTYLVHYKGECDIKKGTFDSLKPFKDGLIDRGLNATID